MNIAQYGAGALESAALPVNILDRDVHVVELTHRKAAGIQRRVESGDLHGDLTALHLYGDAPTYHQFA